jgi:hypothetical protein
MKESGELRGDQESVFEWLLEYVEGHEDPPTRRELHQWLAVDKGNSRAQLEGPNLVKPRLTELKEKDLVEENEKRECSVTGKKARPVVPTEYQSSLSTDSSEEDGDLVEVDGEKYVFDPRSDPAVDVDDGSQESPRNEDSDGSEHEEQKILFDKGEVVG